jgi:hypothetical protein
VRLLSRLAAVAIAAFALAGCGASAEDSAEDFQGEERNVAQAVEDLQDAAGDRDGEEVCAALVTERLRNAISSSSREPCPEALDELLGDANEFELTVEDVAISGTTATVRVTSGTGDEERADRLRFERDGRTWRLDALG